MKYNMEDYTNVLTEKELVDFFENEMPAVDAVVNYGSAWYQQGGVNQQIEKGFGKKMKKRTHDSIVLTRTPLKQWHAESYTMNPIRFGKKHRYTVIGKLALVDDVLPPKIMKAERSEFKRNFGCMYFKLGKKREIKLLVVNTDYAIKSMTTWEHISIAARFQKEVGVEINNIPDELAEAMYKNNVAATVAALFLHEEDFIPLNVFNETRCNLSYIGDVRMKTGAEDPDKAKNISEGSAKFFNRLYEQMPFMEITDGYVKNPHDFALIHYLPQELQQLIYENCVNNEDFGIVKETIYNYFTLKNKKNSKELTGRCFWTIGFKKSITVFLEKIKKGAKTKVCRAKQHVVMLVEKESEKVGCASKVYVKK